MKKQIWKDASVSRYAVRLLHICFPLILAQLFLITLHLFLGEYPTHIYAIRLYRGMLEYIMLDVCIAVVGAFLIDITLKQIGKD